jgi:hypothetical protein
MNDNIEFARLDRMKSMYFRGRLPCFGGRQAEAIFRVKRL